MPTWILYSIIAQFLYSIVALIDKYIVTSKTVPRPIVYAFYVSLLSTTGILFFFLGFIHLPFESLKLPDIANVSLPNLNFIILSFIMAYSLVCGFIALFKTFEKSDASDVVPLFQSGIAVFSVLLPFFVFNQGLQSNFIVGFIFLVIGTILVSRFRVTKRNVFLTILAGLLFAIQIFIFDILADPTYFEFSNRDNALFWTRFSIGLAALSLLILPNCCGQTAKTDVEHTKRRKGFFLIIFNKIIAGVAGFLLVTSVSLAEGSDLGIVNALGGLQFLFLLLFAIFLGNKTPYACGEDCTRRERTQKVISVLIISIGFILLFI